MVKDNPIFENIAQDIYSSNLDAIVALEARRREDELRYQAAKDQKINDLEKQVDGLNQTIVDKDNQLADKDNQLADKDNQLADKDNQLAKKNQEIRDSILNLYKNGVSIELIAKSTGRSEQEVSSIVSLQQLILN